MPFTAYRMLIDKAEGVRPQASFKAPISAPLARSPLEGHDSSRSRTLDLFGAKLLRVRLIS
jgi:hypothetical protein